MMYSSKSLNVAALAISSQWNVVRSVKIGRSDPGAAEEVGFEDWVDQLGDHLENNQSSQYDSISDEFFYGSNDYGEPNYNMSLEDFAADKEYELADVHAEVTSDKINAFEMELFKDYLNDHIVTGSDSRDVWDWMDSINENSATLEITQKEMDLGIKEMKGNALLMPGDTFEGYSSELLDMESHIWKGRETSVAVLGADNDVEYPGGGKNGSDGVVVGIVVIVFIVVFMLYCICTSEVFSAGVDHADRSLMG